MGLKETSTMPTLTTKALVLGLSSILGGTGVALGSEHFDNSGIELAAPSTLVATESVVHEVEAEEESESHGRSIAAHERRTARAAERAIKHEERKTLRDERRAAQSAILADRAAPGEGPRGPSPEARRAMRELAPGRAISRERRSERSARRGPPAGRGNRR